MTRKAVSVLVPLLALLPVARTQTVSGEVTGTVSDPAGALVVGAAVELTNEVSQQTRSFKTDTNGNFLFSGVVPGEYRVTVSHPGFKVYKEEHIQVAAQERVALHEIKLAVGDVNTTVEVSGEVAHVQTDSSDRTITVNQTQIQDTPMAGRSYLGLIRSLPGTQVTTTADTRAGGGTVSINGGQQGQILVTLDGISQEDSGTYGSGGFISPNIDSIGEVQVLVSNYTAEYGSRAGGQINVQIKNGTNQFHGTAYYYWRHEMLDANEWFNNKNTITINGIPGQATPKPLYRYQNPGGTIGGPVIIPGTNFNKSRTKLFFFFSEDYLHHLGTNGPNRYTMPTPLERSGDFSQTVTSTGVLIPIIDPTSGHAFPNNMVPKGNFSALGQYFMSLFPLPNGAVDPTGQRGYNSQFQWTSRQPQEDRILRVDYNVSPKDTAYLRLIQDYTGSDGYSGWGQLNLGSFDIPSAGAVATEVHTFRQNVVNEFTWGINRGHQETNIYNQQQYNTYKVSALPSGVGVPALFPGANVLNLLPNVNFTTNNAQSAGQAITGAAPSFGWDTRFPFDGTETQQNITDNVTWIKGVHNFKFGFFYDHVARNVNVFATNTVEGTYWFGSDTANPYDTGYGFSNLLLGSVQAYGADNVRLVNHGRYKSFEWFAQDTWRLNRRLTIDLGVRFQHIGPDYSQGATLELFRQALYNRSQEGNLLLPAVVSGQKVAIDPVTGATYSYARQGTWDPASYAANGSPFSGMQTYQTSIFNDPPIAIGPRVGLAWDVFGDGKTALRAGFGIFYGRGAPVDAIAAPGNAGGPMQAPPAFQAPIFYNTTFGNLSTAQGFLSPQGVYGGPNDPKNPSTYDWSFGIQRDLSRGFILDVAYTGNVAHHKFPNAGPTPSSNDFNAVPPLTTWNPATGINKTFQDPTNSTGGLYNANIIRSLASTGYYGYTSIYTWTFAGESYYDALQVQLNKRFGSRFQMSSNWTWSKTITFNRQQWVPDALTKNVANRPQAVNINFGYRLPDGSFFWKNRFTSAALDGWNFNGVGSYYMGTPMTVTCAASSVPANLGNYWTGTPTGGIPFNCAMLGGLWLPKGSTPATVGSLADPRLWYPFNAGTAANPQLWNPSAAAANTSSNPGFVLPAPTTLGFGNTPNTLTYGPGFENWDLSLYKEFRLGRETRVLQLRIETFNTLNHFNPGNPNTSLTYNFATGAQTNANFGTITSAQNTARHSALSLRFRF